MGFNSGFKGLIYIDSYMFRASHVHHQEEHISINNNLTFIFSPLCSKTFVITSKYDLYWMEMRTNSYNAFNRILIRSSNIGKVFIE